MPAISMVFVTALVSTTNFIVTQPKGDQLYCRVKRSEYGASSPESLPDLFCLQAFIVMCKSLSEKI